MFTLSLALVPLVIAVLLLCLHFNAKRYDRKNSEGERYDGGFVVGMVVMLIIALVPVIVSIIATFGAYSSQISDAENIAKFERLEEVYEARANALTEQFASYLADLYPEHERNVFESISPEGIDIYLVKYPNLKASETILELIAQIRSMQDDRYAQQVSRENTLKDMRYRMRNPWIFNSFILEG